MRKKIASGLYATIDIGTTSVKTIVVEVTDKGKRLLKVASESINLPNQSNDEESHNKQITEAISKLTKDLELNKCQKISSVYNNRELQVKIIDLPSQVKKDQLSNVLVWEAKKLLSSHYKEQEFAFAYSIIKEEPFSVALAVVPQVLLENHIKLFEGTGIKPSSVYVDVFSALALRPIVDIAGLPALSILNFGNTGTHLQIFSAGKLKFYRFIPSGTQEMSNPPKESELEIYFQKIRFSFDYFRAVSKLSQVDTIYFMGGGSQHDQVIPYAKNYFNPTQIHILDVSSTLDISPIISSIMDDKTPANSSSSKILSYVPAIGACLADFDKNADSMDLMTRLNSIEKEKKRENLVRVLPAVVATLVVIICFITLFSIRQNKVEELKQANLQIESLKSIIESNNTVIKNIISKRPKHQTNLCLNSKMLVEPVIKKKVALFNLFAMIMNLKGEDISISDILIRNRQEAEQIELKQEEKDIFGDGIEDIEKDPQEQFISKLTSAINEEQIKDDFDGKIIIIHATARSYDQISSFTNGLSSYTKDSQNRIRPKVINRIISLKTQKISRGRIEFLLKGEYK